MRILRSLFLRVTAAFHKQKWNEQMREEIATNLQFHVEDNVLRGLSPEEARRQAILAVGSPERIRETYADHKGLPWLENLGRDLTYAARALRQSPTFSAVIVLTLALGIGANTAIFGLINAVLLEALPVSHPEQLYTLETSSVQVGSISLQRSLGNDTIEQITRRTPGIQDVASYFDDNSLNISVDGQSEIEAGQFVSGNFFSFVGVRPLLGRGIEPEDMRSTNRIAVLSYPFWQRRFAGASAAIGRSITVDNVPFTVVGIAPAGFSGLEHVENMAVLLPVATMPQVKFHHLSNARLKADDFRGTPVVRLRAGASAEQAAAQATAAFHQTLETDAANKLGAEERKVWRKLSIVLTPAGRDRSLAMQFSKPLWALMGLVGLVLLIACANIANLLLARASTRARETAIRLSLGCTRARLIRQLLVEGFLLSVLGGIAALPVAIWAERGIVYLSGNRGADNLPLGVNSRLLAFTAAACLVTAMLCSILPAIRASATDLNSLFKGALAARGSQQALWRKALVVCQIALALALLVGAALFVGTLRNLNHIDLGFARDRTVVASTDATLAGYGSARAAAMYRKVLDRVSAIPGVPSATIHSTRKLNNFVNLTRVQVPGYQSKRGESSADLWAVINSAGPRFIEAAGIRLLAGRDFTEADSRVALIDERTARDFFGVGNPLGRQIKLSQGNKTVEIVGVIGNLKYLNLQGVDQDFVLVPFFGDPDAIEGATLVIRTAGAPEQVAAQLQTAIRSVDARLPVYGVMTMEQQVRRAMRQGRMLALLASVFGLLALVLCAVGVYGVLSYGVAQRTSEIGIRMALGAARRSVVRMVLAENLQMLALGVLAGLAIAFGAGRFLKSLLFGLSATDAWSLAVSALILASVALLAAWLPALRASRIDPMQALRHE